MTTTATTTAPLAATATATTAAELLTHSGGGPAVSPALPLSYPVDSMDVKRSTGKERARFAWLLVAALLCPGRAFPADVPFNPDEPQPPYSIEKLRAWHRTFDRWPSSYPPEQQARLRSGGPPQLLLCSGGGARSGTYVLFTKRRGVWVPISGAIDQAHHPLHRLRHTVSGWHDFESFLPLWGSGGEDVMVVHYRWRRGQYRELSSRSGKWCDFEPFKSDKEICGHPLR
jgi:hypothetical protein